MSTNILLVEDNPSDIELVQTAFEESEIDIVFTVYRDGDEAIAGLRDLARDVSWIPEIALVDLNLPRASGHDVLATIRANPVFGNMPVLILSSSNHPSDRLRCMAAGASEYLVKPPQFKQLLVMVDRIAKRWLRKTT